MFHGSCILGECFWYGFVVVPCMCVKYLKECWGRYKIYVEKDGVYGHLIESAVCCNHKCGDVWVLLGRTCVVVLIWHGPIVGVGLFGWHS